MQNLDIPTTVNVDDASDAITESLILKLWETSPTLDCRRAVYKSCIDQWRKFFLNREDEGWRSIFFKYTFVGYNEGNGTLISGRYSDPDGNYVSYETSYLETPAAPWERNGRTSIEKSVLLNVGVTGRTDQVISLLKELDSQFQRARNQVEWVYSPEGDTTIVPLRTDMPVHEKMFPFLKKSFFQYCKGYLDSSASILILIGPPGTGKTSFIRGFLDTYNLNAKISYDAQILEKDRFFANFMSSSSEVLVLEDADRFLKTKNGERSSLMHRFLSVSDGLASSMDKKIIFSTNLENLHDIDRALVRPGRCFDVVEFRPLAYSEAIHLCSAMQRSAPEKERDYTLAELLNPGSYVLEDIKPARKPGFGFQPA